MFYKPLLCFPTLVVIFSTRTSSGKPRPQPQLPFPFTDHSHTMHQTFSAVLVSKYKSHAGRTVVPGSTSCARTPT